MTSRMVGSVLTLLTLLFSAGGGAAQTYTQMQWGMNKGVTPYAFGANINGTWRDLGTVSSGGVWNILSSTIAFTQTGTGAIASTVDAKLKQQTFNAADFGLVNNPSCSIDQTTRLQNAINATGSNTLRISGTLTACITQVTITNEGFKLSMEEGAKLLMTDPTKSGIKIGTPESVTPGAVTYGVTLDGVQISAKPGVVMNSGTYAIEAYQTVNFWLHNGSIGYYNFYDGNIYLYNGVLIDGFSEARIDGVTVGAVAQDGFDIFGRLGQGTNISFLNNAQIYCDPGNPGTASRNNGAGIVVWGGAGGVALQNLSQATCNNGLALVSNGVLDNREIFIGQQAWFDSNKAYGIYVDVPTAGKAPYGILDCNGCWVASNKAGGIYVSSGQLSTSRILVNDIISYGNGTTTLQSAIRLDGGIMDMNGGFISLSSGNGIALGSGASATINDPSIELSGSYGIFGAAGSTIRMGTGNFASNTSGNFLSTGTVTGAVIPSSLTIGNSGVSAGSLAFANATSGTITLQPATGALGTVTATLPANTGTIAELNLAQTFSANQTFGATNLRVAGSSTGVTTIGTANSSATDYTATLPANTGTIAELNLAQTFSAAQTFSGAIISAGTSPTATGSGGTCAAGAVAGGALVGTVALTAVCASTDTLALTNMPAAATGYVCDAADRTTGVLNLVQTATTTTSATFTFNASTGATDVIQFKCIGY